MWPNPQETANLFTFTEEILNGKLHFCAVIASRSVGASFAVPSSNDKVFLCSRSSKLGLLSTTK